MATRDIMQCQAPALEPGVRASMPAGIAALYGFIVVWLGCVLIAGWSSAQLLISGERIEAYTVAPVDPLSRTRAEREWSAQHVDALGGIHRFALPIGVQAGPGGRFEVLRHGKVYGVPSRVWSNLGVATFMALFGLIPLFVARHSRKALKRDLERLETLRCADHQIAAIAVRTVQVKSPRRRRHGRTPPPWFRIWATFEHAGHIYEAPADMQPDDPGPIDPRTIRVHLHPRDPFVSMVLRVLPNTRHGR